MGKIKLLDKIDFLLFGWIIHLAYPQYYRPKYGYQKYYTLFFYFVIPQKVFRLNSKTKWPVHFTSKVICPENITKGILCDPGDNPGIYIQANNKIIIGSNVGFGAGSKIISSIHSHNNHSTHDVAAPIVIGNNVFIGSNSVILPSVTIGNNVVIGAGSIVAKDIPSNSIAVGNPCRVIKQKEAYTENIADLTLNRKVPIKIDND